MLLLSPDPLIFSFYRGAQIGIGDEFLVIPIGGVTEYYDKKGIAHRYIPRRHR